MKKFYEIWEPVLKAFEMNCPEYYEQMVDWYPSAHLQITVKLRDGRIINYEFVDDLITVIDDPNDKHNKLNEDDWRDAFAERLRNRIRTSGISQDRLSESTGISRVTISKYVNGKALPSVYNMRLIAKALKCSVTELTDI